MDVDLYEEMLLREKIRKYLNENMHILDRIIDCDEEIIKKKRMLR